VIDSGGQLDAVVARLEAAGCVAADEEAADYVALAPDDATLEAWLRRREAGEPSAWITGTMLFCGRPLRVDRGVFVPRDQTEELARRAEALLPDGGRALDLCTGAGAVAAHLRAVRPGAILIGTDVDHRAAANAGRNGVPAVVSDLDAALRPATTFDVVTAVAPYVPTGDLHLLPVDVQRHEPGVALDGGADGLDVVRRVVAVARRRLRPGGWLLVEIGGTQDEALTPDLRRAGFADVTTWRDEDGDLRGLAARLTDSRVATVS
jgi:release factor glutamine methyltransferase